MHRGDGDRSWLRERPRHLRPDRSAAGRTEDGCGAHLHRLESGGARHRGCVRKRSDGFGSRLVGYDGHLRRRHDRPAATSPEEGHTGGRAAARARNRDPKWTSATSVARRDLHACFRNRRLGCSEHTSVESILEGQLQGCAPGVATPDHLSRPITWDRGRGAFGMSPVEWWGFGERFGPPCGEPSA